MKAQVGAFNQEKVLVGAFSVITKLRVDLCLKLYSPHSVFWEASEVPMTGDSGTSAGVICCLGSQGRWGDKHQPSAAIKQQPGATHFTGIHAIVVLTTSLDIIFFPFILDFLEIWLTWSHPRLHAYYTFCIEKVYAVPHSKRLRTSHLPLLMSFHFMLQAVRSPFYSFR